MASSPNGEDKNGENLLSFETWRRKVAWVTGLGLSEDEERRRSEVILLQNAQKDWDTCEKRKRELWHNSEYLVPNSSTRFGSEFDALSRSRCRVHGTADETDKL